MIAAAGVEDQELPIAAKSSGVNNPTVAGRGNLAARPGGDRKTFLSSARAVGTAELPQANAIDWQMQMPAHIGESDRRRKSPRVAQGGKFRMRGIGGNAAVGLPAGALGAVEPGFELGDQVLDVIDLPRQVGRPLALAGERQLGTGLLFLPLVDQQA